jgi:hypothetical protein
MTSTEGSGDTKNDIAPKKSGEYSEYPFQSEIDDKNVEILVGSKKDVL